MVFFLQFEVLFIYLLLNDKELSYILFCLSSYEEKITSAYFCMNHCADDSKQCSDIHSIKITTDKSDKSCFLVFFHNLN